MKNTYHGNLSHRAQRIIQRYDGQSAAKVTDYFVHERFTRDDLKGYTWGFHRFSPKNADGAVYAFCCDERIKLLQGHTSVCGRCSKSYSYPASMGDSGHLRRRSSRRTYPQFNKTKSSGWSHRGWKPCFICGKVGTEYSRVEQVRLYGWVVGVHSWCEVTNTEKLDKWADSYRNHPRPDWKGWDST